jgi:hypothetical protein
MVKVILSASALMGSEPKPILHNEDESHWRNNHQGFGEADNNVMACIEHRISWSCFDYREKTKYSKKLTKACR